MKNNNLVQKTTRKIFPLLISALLLLFLVPSCEKDDPETPVEERWVTIRSTEEYHLDLGISGDEEFARFSVQAQHGQISELLRDAATNFHVVYHYQPEPGYTGGDYAEVEVLEGVPGKPVDLKKIFRFHFNVMD